MQKENYFIFDPKILIMTLTNLPLVSWGNGAFMIGVFAFVCVVLTVAVILLIMGGKKPKKKD